MDKQAQIKKILDVLEYGKAPRNLFLKLGIASFTSRIHDLRNLGYNIKCTELPRINGQRRTEYELIK